MFDLEQAMTRWRRQMAASGISSPETLDELESHLLEEVERHTNSGLDLAQAFEASIQNLGQVEVLKSEFAKVSGANETPERLQQFIRALAGILNPSLATTMNTQHSPSESAWMTYLRGVGFLVPALTLWIFSIIWLFPKLNQIRMEAGIGLPRIYPVALFVTQHWMLLGGALAFGLFLLERRVSRWPRYRRTVVGAGVFLLNSTVMILITTMVILALLAAGALLSHAK
jgi:hypothetical protein